MRHAKSMFIVCDVWNVPIESERLFLNMKITLDNFESYVPSKILYRGEAYYDGGAVMNLEETDGV